MNVRRDIERLREALAIRIPGYLHRPKTRQVFRQELCVEEGKACSAEVIYGKGERHFRSIR